MYNEKIISNDIKNFSGNQLKNSKNYFHSPSQFLIQNFNQQEKLKKKNELNNFDMASNLIKIQQLNLNVDSDSSSDDDEEKKKKQSEKEKKRKKKKKKNSNLTIDNS
jgi:hypothetical protein